MTIEQWTVVGMVVGICLIPLLIHLNYMDRK